MTPTDWLSQNAPGFDSLSTEERQAIADFALLWSLFEAEALATRGSATAIISATGQWRAQSRLDPLPFQTSLSYFKSRYYAQSSPTQHFHDLNFGSKDRKPFVEGVFSGSDSDPSNCVPALLIVVYRLRNNLFHGVKWAYGIQGQLQNFDHANQVLLHSLSIARTP